MNKTTWVVATLTLFAPIIGPAQDLPTNPGNKQLQLSIQNGISSILADQSIDSVYFLKTGFSAGVQGNYFWNTFGLAGRAGYFANGTDMQALEDFARKRKAPRDRVQMSSGAYKGLYLLTGPAFQSTFNKWRIQSSLEGGLISKPASQVLIGDIASPDIVYYRNVFEESSSFAWSAGLSVSYAISRQILLGVNADYLNTKNEVVNYDIQRGNGHEAKNITSQAGFLNTGLRVSYLFNTPKTREVQSGLATGKRQHKPLATSNDGNDKMDNTIANAGKSNEQQQSDTCRCEDKVMDVKQMSPYVVEIKFATVAEAKEFLDTYQPLLERRDVASGQATGKRQHMTGAQSNPLYQASHNSGTNPLYESKRTTNTGSNTDGNMRGVVQRNAKGEQEFYLLPTVVDLAEVLSFEDGRVTVHVQNYIESNTPSTREAGSGMATGRRTYKAIAVGDLDGDGVDDLMLRSSGTFTGNSTKDITDDPELAWGSMIATGDVDGDGRLDYTLQSSGSDKLHLTSGGVMHEDDWQQQRRDVSSGQSSGKRQARDVSTGQSSGKRQARDVSTGQSTGKRQARDVATGLATGKRQHKPIAIGDLDSDGRPDLLLLSAGHEIKSPRDAASGQASGKRVNKVEALTIKQSILLEADLDGDGEFESMHSVKSPRDAASGQATGKRTAAKEDVYVWKIKFADLDGDGVEEGFVCSGSNKDAMMLRSNVSNTFNIILGEAGDESSRKFNKKAEEGYQSGNEGSANKVVEKTTSGIKQTMQTQVLMTNDTSSNENVQKAGISTSRSNIRTKRLVSSSNGETTIECEIELNGRTYSAVIRAKHDTAKNAIGNIR